MPGLQLARVRCGARTEGLRGGGGVLLTRGSEWRHSRGAAAPRKRVQPVAKVGNASGAWATEVRTYSGSSLSLLNEGDSGAFKDF